MGNERIVCLIAFGVGLVAAPVSAQRSTSDAVAHQEVIRKQRDEAYAAVRSYRDQAINNARQRDHFQDQAAANRRERDVYRDQAAAAVRERDTYKEQAAGAARERDTYKEQVAAVAGERDTYRDQAAASAKDSQYYRSAYRRSEEEVQALRKERDYYRSAYQRSEVDRPGMPPCCRVVPVGPPWCRVYRGPAGELPYQGPPARQYEDRGQPRSPDEGPQAYPDRDTRDSRDYPGDSYRASSRYPRSR